MNLTARIAALAVVACLVAVGVVTANDGTSIAPPSTKQPGWVRTVSDRLAKAEEKSPEKYRGVMEKLAARGACVVIADWGTDVRLNAGCLPQVDAEVEAETGVDVTGGVEVPR